MDFGVARSRKILRRSSVRSQLETALTAYDSWSTQARTATRPIEGLREAYENSSRSLQYSDLGKGAGRIGQGTEGQQVHRTVSDVSRSSAPEHQCRLLYSLVDTYRPMSCLELGTCLGISAGYLATALQNNGSGRLYTIEGADVLAGISQGTLNQLGLTNTEICTGAFDQVLPDLLPIIKPVDFVFIDGHHRGEAMIKYFSLIKPFLAGSSIVVLDDLSWSRDMRSAWNEIRTCPRIARSVDLVTLGICEMN